MTDKAEGAIIITVRETVSLRERKDKTMKRRTKRAIMTTVKVTALTMFAIIVMVITYTFAGRYNVQATVTEVDAQTMCVTIEDTTGNVWECYAEGLVEGQKVTVTLHDKYLDDVVKNNTIVKIKPIKVNVW